MTKAINDETGVDQTVETASSADFVSLNLAIHGVLDVLVICIICAD